MSGIAFDPLPDAKRYRQQFVNTKTLHLAIVVDEHDSGCLIREFQNSLSTTATRSAHPKIAGALEQSAVRFVTRSTYNRHGHNFSRARRDHGADRIGFGATGF